MILFLDTTTDTYALALATRAGKILRIKKIVRDERIGDKLFTAITGFLKTKKLAGIIAVTGPGRFSGIRQSIAIANTLAFAWGVPLAGVEKNEGDTVDILLERGICQFATASASYLLPAYGMEPTITLSR